MYKILTLILSLITSLSLYSQEKIINGVVLNAEREPVKGAIVKTSRSRASVKTGKDGSFSIPVTPKDKELRMILHGKTIMSLPTNVDSTSVVFAMDPSNDPSIRGYLKGDTYYPGSVDLEWKDVINSYFPGVIYNEGQGTVSIARFQTNTLSTIGDFTCQYYELDGSPVPNLDVIELPSVYSVRIIKDMAQSLIYGAAGQFGAVIITTRGMQKVTEE